MDIRVYIDATALQKTGEHNATNTMVYPRIDVKAPCGFVEDILREMVTSWFSLRMEPRALAIIGAGNSIHFATSITHLRFQHETQIFDTVSLGHRTRPRRESPCVFTKNGMKAASSWSEANTNSPRPGGSSCRDPHPSWIDEQKVRLVPFIVSHTTCYTHWLTMTCLFFSRYEKILSVQHKSHLMFRYNIKVVWCSGTI